MKLHMDELYRHIQNRQNQPSDKSKELILDVRDAEDYSEVHVPGSKSIPHDLILANPEKYKAELARFDKVFIHCGGGGKAGRAYEALSNAGLKNIVHICDSGMRSWIAAGYPVKKETK